MDYSEKFLLLQEIEEIKKEANDFIIDIAKLFGEDDLGHDGKSWSIDDFQEAINKIRQDAIEEFRKWLLIENNKLWTRWSNIGDGNFDKIFIEAEAIIESYTLPTK